MNRTRTAARQHKEVNDRLKELLTQDLGFHDAGSPGGLHNMHAFPAKFPPQLPRLFIDALTLPGETVLDPMLGSGTTVIEAMLAGRRGVGFDIDPIALRLCRVKSTPIVPAEALAAGERVADGASRTLADERPELLRYIDVTFDQKTREFADYWFDLETQLELSSLLQHIVQVENPAIREFLEVAFSAIIITKSGGVSRARDLAHTRPHRVADKQPRHALPEFRKRLTKNVRALDELGSATGTASVTCGNAEALPLLPASVDIIVTSPPYASNAIDYMRAHKFSLVWFGHPIADLSELRGKYIGGEGTTGFSFSPLPARPCRVVEAVGAIDASKGRALRRYYSEMTKILSEMERVLKPGKAAVVVVGTSTLRGIDAETPACLGEIGEAVGLRLVGIAARALDRNRRMMPARFGGKTDSQIEQRMHEEQVVAFIKPL